MNGPQVSDALPSRLRCIAAVWWLPPSWRAALREAADMVDAYQTASVDTEQVWRAVERLETGLDGLKAALSPERDEDGVAEGEAA